MSQTKSFEVTEPSERIDLAHDLADDTSPTSRDEGDAERTLPERGPDPIAPERSMPMAVPAFERARDLAPLPRTRSAHGTRPPLPAVVPVAPLGYRLPTVLPRKSRAVATPPPIPVAALRSRPRTVLPPPPPPRPRIAVVGIAPLPLPPPPPARVTLDVIPEQIVDAAADDTAAPTLPRTKVSRPARKSSLRRFAVPGVVVGVAAAAAAGYALFGGHASSSASAGAVAKPQLAVAMVAIPAPAQVVAQPAVTPAPSTAIDVRVDSEPAGASAMLVDNGKTSWLGTTPLHTALEPAKGYDVVLVMAEHRTEVAHVDPSTTRALAISLATASMPTLAVTPVARPARKHVKHVSTKKLVQMFTRPRSH